MSRSRILTALGVIGALMATSVSPAMAGSYGGINIGSSHGNIGYGLNYGRGWGGSRGYRGYGRRHRDRVDTGDVIGAIAVIGVIAAIASAASKKNRTATNDRDSGRYPDDRRDDQREGSIRSEDAAVDACAVAAEERAGQTSSVRDITDVKRSSDGWDVEGVVEERESWRDRTADKRRFTCSVRFGRVENVYIESSKVAFAD